MAREPLPPIPVSLPVDWFARVVLIFLDLYGLLTTAVLAWLAWLHLLGGAS